MPHTLREREVLMERVAKQVTFRDAVLFLASWSPLVMYKHEGRLCRFPSTERLGVCVDPDVHDHRRLSLVDDICVEYSGDVFNDMMTLFKKYPKSRLYHTRGPENCDYTDMTVDSKDCYLSFVPVRCTNTLYSYNTKDSHDIISSASVRDNSSIIYQSSRIVNSHKIFWSNGIMTSSNIWHSSNLMNCERCRGCSGLQNKKYCFENEQLSREEFEKKLGLLLVESYQYKQKQPREYENFGSLGCEDSQWCISCEDLETSMNSFQVTHGKNVLMSSSSKGSRERYNTYLTGNANHVYSILHSGGEAEYCYNCVGVNRCTHVYYSVRLQTCSFCFGCVGLMNKSYCIFNKQYSKEDRYDKVDNIFHDMEQKGMLGSFFPATLCPFYLNDTVASLIVDIEKEEAVQCGYVRRDNEVKVDIPEWMEVVEVSELGEYEGWKIGMQDISSVPVGTQNITSIPEEAIRHIDPSILKKVIRDEEGNVYRVIKMEYDFLVKYGLPLPKTHWLTRLKAHFRKEESGEKTSEKR